MIYFESENAVSKDMLEQRGLDTNRIVIMPVATVQEFRLQAIRVLDKYLEQEKDKKKTYHVRVRFFRYVINNKRNGRYSRR